jgi:hypothetical protein
MKSSVKQSKVLPPALPKLPGLWSKPDTTVFFRRKVERGMQHCNINQPSSVPVPAAGRYHNILKVIFREPIILEPLIVLCISADTKRVTAILGLWPSFSRSDPKHS